MKLMIEVKEERACPNCQRRKAEAMGSFECPECHAGLCGLCWIVIPGNNGNSVECPNCQAKITLVKHKVREEIS